MRLTTRGRYAVTAMLDLALHAGESPVCVNTIAERQDLSPAYLERLFRQMRSAGLVDSTRGARGGYRLCRDCAEISVADIIAAVDGPLDATRCGGAEDCRGDGGRCLTHDLWADLSRHIEAFLSRQTLDCLCERERRRRAEAAEVPLRQISMTNSL